MSGSIEKAQFDRLAAIIDDSFGIADENGNVIFSEPDKLWEDRQIHFIHAAEAD